MSVIEHLVKTLRDLAIFNPYVHVSPSCILWPNKDPRQHEFTVQLRAFDEAKFDAKYGVASFIVLCTSLLKAMAE